MKFLSRLFSNRTRIDADTRGEIADHLEALGATGLLVTVRVWD